MDKQNAILKTHELEVIGQGPMIETPCQIGEWWVMPAEQYTGTIPPDIQEKWDNFKALNIPVLGYLIADDMRDVLVKRSKEAEEALELERKAEQKRQREVARQNELMALEQKRLAEIQSQVEKRRLEIERQHDLERQREADRQALIRRQKLEESAKEAGKVALAVVGTIATVAAAVVTGVVVLTVGAALAAIRFCPVLIAVLPDGRWICVGAWWD
jgi:hypothetical protein